MRRALCRSPRKRRDSLMARVQNCISLLERLQSRRLSVRGSRCVIVRNRNASCRRCAEACTSECITLRDNELAVNPERCIGCGTCATVCPTGALEAREPNDRDLLKCALESLRDNNGTVVFICAELARTAAGRFNPTAIVTVACLGRLEESELVFLAAAGARSIRLAHGNCASCACAPGIKTAQSVCESTNNLLACWNVALRITLAPRMPAFCRLTGKSAFDEARRDFFFSLADEGKTAAHEAADFALNRVLSVDEGKLQRPPHVTEAGTLPTHLPRRRSLLLDSLEHLGKPRDELVATRLWGHVVIDAERCTSCRMCAVFCPTGALSLYERADEQELAHAPGLCVKCHTCESVCPHEAIRLSDEVFAVDLHARFVEKHSLRDLSAEKSGPDAIRNSMAKLINSPYLWG